MAWFLHIPPSASCVAKAIWCALHTLTGIFLQYTNVTHTSSVPYCLRHKGSRADDLFDVGNGIVQISRRHYPQPQRRSDRDKWNARPHAHSREARTGRGFVRLYAGTKSRIVEMGASNTSADVWLATAFRSVLGKRIGGRQCSQIYSKPEGTSSEPVVRG